MIWIGAAVVKARNACSAKHAFSPEYQRYSAIASFLRLAGSLSAIGYSGLQALSL